MPPCFVVLPPDAMAHLLITASHLFSLNTLQLQLLPSFHMLLAARRKNKLVDTKNIGLTELESSGDHRLGRVEGRAGRMQRGWLMGTRVQLDGKDNF